MAFRRPQIKQMIRCAIVGAGQIGSRHLQALCQLKSPARIDLVDPSNESLQIAQKRFAEAYSPKNHAIELHCHKNPDDLPDVLDLVIVATNSDVRTEVIHHIAGLRSVKNFLLEKVLFQRKEQYFEMERFLKENPIPTWVNCWMRTTDLFKQIKSALNLKHSIQMKVEGPQWRMGGNSIHFMDLFSFLTGSGDFKFTDVHLENKLLDSKRAGFKEFLGQIAGKNFRGDSLELICHDKGDGPTRVEVVNGPEKYQVAGLSGNVDFKSSNGLANRIGQATLPYQSQLTHLWVDDILTRGSCDLPTYSESMPLHLELIRIFTNHLQQVIGKEVEACPIT